MTNTWMMAAVDPFQYHKEPVKTVPANYHCSTVVLGPSTQHKNSNICFHPGEGYVKRKGSSRTNAVPLFFLISGLTHKGKKQYKKCGRSWRHLDYPHCSHKICRCVKKNAILVLPLIHLKLMCFTKKKEKETETHFVIIMWFCVLTGPLRYSQTQQTLHTR